MSCFPPCPCVSIVGKAGDVKIPVRTSHPGDALGGEESNSALPRMCRAVVLRKTRQWSED